MRHCLGFTLVAAALSMTGVAYANCPGDINCDNIVDFGDIDPFVAALGCAGGDPNCWPGSCPWINADCNGDDAVNFDDIDPFVALFGTTCSGGGEIMDVPLAGNSLAAYPYFEYVKAFNEDATVEVALDPTRYPEIVGETADVYVVQAKSQGGWAGDPSLADATTDGPLTVTFSGTTVQENTFTVVGAFELNSAVFQAATGDYTGLGKGYDVVVDMNQNGVLDGGDYIDGRSREAGLYIIHDTTQQGPLAVTQINSYSVGTVYGIPDSKKNERCYFPTDIQNMDPLPLIVVSHGNGHDYTWYDHIGQHMGSYGYIVMSHQNNTGPGIEEASVTTLGHTEAFIELGQAGSIPGAEAIAGKIDTSRIIWIGHSRGAEGVARAYDRMFDSDYTHGAVPPQQYGMEDIVLISSMLPVDFLKTDKSNPHNANYHLWTASGDADVNGSASCDLCQTYHLHDRATRYRMSTTVQGTGHAWFHTGGGSSVFTGPCPIGQENTTLVQLGLFLPLIKHYAENNIPATDFFWRQYEHFHPIGVDTSNPCIVVTNEYRNGNEEGNFFIDDYQTGTATNVSSSGGAVTYTVDNVLEGRLDDNNSSYTWSSGDPFNGATQCSSEGSDDSRGVVFDWNGGYSYYEWEVIPEARDFSDDLFLSVRGAQGTQHPYTLDFLGDTTFTITLRDAMDTTSSINIGAYGGGGLEQPFQREGGWHNEMEVNRIRITDFLTNDSGIDLTDIVAVRFEFGPDYGSDQGRIVVDELMLTNDYPPFFVSLAVSLPTTPPEFIPPSTPTEIDVEIFPGDDTLVEGSATLHYSYDSGDTWNSTPLTQVAGELWRGTLPAPTCGDLPVYYFAAEGATTGVVYNPVGGAASPFVSYVGTFVSILNDDFQTDMGWTFEDDPTLTSGGWERTMPTSDGSYGEPTQDYDGSGQCLLTENGYHRDVDYGPTWATSPLLDLSGMTAPVLRYAYWMACDDAGVVEAEDYMYVELSDDGGETWVSVAVYADQPGWEFSEVQIADYIDLTSQVYVRFWTEDTPNNSKAEAAIDAVQIFDVSCP